MKQDQKSIDVFTKCKKWNNFFFWSVQVLIALLLPIYKWRSTVDKKYSDMGVTLSRHEKAVSRIYQGKVWGSSGGLTWRSHWPEGGGSSGGTLRRVGLPSVLLRKQARKPPSSALRRWRIWRASKAFKPEGDEKQGCYVTISSFHHLVLVCWYIILFFRIFKQHPSG